MAQPQSQSQSQPQLQAEPESDRLSQLRALAQSHLTEIDTEKSQEEVQLSQAEAEIQRYSKMSSFDRKRHASSGSKSRQGQSDQQQQQRPPTSISQDAGAMDMTKKERFRPFPEILHRLQWDPRFDINEYTVGYLERFEGIKEIAASSWIRDFSDEEWIPMHRVRYVKRVRKTGNGDGEDEGPELGTVWDRDGRIDLFTRMGGEEVSNEDVLSMDGTSVTGGVII